MEISNPILLEFINDFQLKSNESGTICFDAVIQYEAKNIYKQLDSEVNIMVIDKKHLTIFFLLDPDIIIHEVPDTLILNPFNFKYNKDVSLVIYGNDLVIGGYSVTVKPLNKNCAEGTLYELRAKKFN
ncbi:MAG: hypothetical protein WDM90_24930 [Ferruginibacter sp.]